MKTTIQPGDGDPCHGTNNGYNNLGCRCDACRVAHTSYLRERGIGSYRRVPCPTCGGTKALRAIQCRWCYYARTEAAHGTESRYTDRGCRCDLCRAASAAARGARRHANIDATRTYDRDYKARKRAAA
jgi:hypothetical protein